MNTHCQNDVCDMDVSDACALPTYTKLPTGRKSKRIVPTPYSSYVWNLTPVTHEKENKSVTEKQRQLCWGYSNKDEHEGHCFVCAKKIYRKERYGWEAAHIVAQIKGGSNMSHNLRATCRQCNGDCRDMNLMDFKKAYWAREKTEDVNGRYPMEIDGDHPTEDFTAFMRSK
jgi:hypothetical protein